MTDKQIIINELKNEIACKENIINHLADSNIELQKQLKAKEQECEKAKQNAQDTYDLWQALIESFNVLQVEKIKLDGAITYLKKENKELSKIIDCKNGTVLSLKQQLDQLKVENDELKEEVQYLKSEIERIGEQ